MLAGDGRDAREERERKLKSLVKKIGIEINKQKTSERRKVIGPFLPSPDPLRLVA